MLLDNEKDITQRRAIFDGRFHILSTIGRGRNSIVYKAEVLPDLRPQAKTGLVALKLLSGKSRTADVISTRLKREALSMLSSRHENVLKLYDFVNDAQRCYLVMELAERSDLKRECERRGKPFSIEEAINLTIQVLLGLEAIHRAGIIHRDIKPENLLLAADETIRIGDFSVARLPVDEIPDEEVHRGVGTLEYLSPEALEGNDISELSDLYSVGVTLFELLTGKLPFSGNSLHEQLTNKLSGKRALLADSIQNVPPQLENILDRALATKPKDRLASASEFRVSLLQVLAAADEGEPAQSAPVIKSDHLEDAAGEAKNITTINLRDRLTKLLQEQVIPQFRPSLTNFNLRLTQILDVARTKQFPRSKVIGVSVGLGLLILVLLSYVWISKSKVSSISTAQNETPLELRLGHVPGTTTHGATYLPVGEHTGLLYRIFSDDSHTPFHLVRLVDPATKKNILIFTLAIPGFRPVILPLDNLDDRGEITIRSNGLEFLLGPEDDSLVPGSLVSGRYKDLVTGRVGTWVIW